MPITRLTLNTTVADVQSLSRELHLLLQGTLGLPPKERMILIDENPETFFPPLDSTGSYALLEINLFEKPTLQAKRALYRGAVELLGRHGIVPENTRIVLHEIPCTNWGLEQDPPE